MFQALHPLLQTRQLLLQPRFFPPPIALRFLEKMKNAPTTPAEIDTYQAEGVGELRSTGVCEVPADVENYFKTHFQRLAPKFSSYFRTPFSRLETPQFFRYVPGDYFKIHRDAIEGENSGIYQQRKLTIIIYLNDDRPQNPQRFQGGQLKLYLPQAQGAKQLRAYPIPSEMGLLVAFPANLYHEVTPVTAGERYTVVAWLG